MSNNNGLRLRRPLQKDTSLGRVSTSFSSHNDEDPRKQSTRKRSPLFALVFVPLALAMASVAIIFIGAEVERVEIDRHRVQLELYTHDDRVCAGDSTTNVFATYSSAAEVPEESTIAHCGGCGVCSNLHDMNIYAGTTQTLTDSATWCSTKGYLQSLYLWRGIDVYRRIAAECLAQNVGFTPSCQDCWLDDMACSIQKCVFTCFKSIFILGEPKNKPDGSLNKCLECDEKICGPDFLKCSGANRRRQGIQSDIMREDDKELCRVVQMDWKTITNE